MSQNTFNNTGNFYGPVFQGSTINNAGQIAGTLTNANAESKEALQSLIHRLGDVLKAVPSDRMEDANAVAASTEDLVKEAAKLTPNKSRLGLLGESVLSGAKAIASAAPKAVALATSIVELVAKIHGIG